MSKRNSVRRFSVALAMLVLSATFAATGQAAPDLDYTFEFLPAADYIQNDEKALLRIATADVYALPLTDVEWRDPQGNVTHCRPSGSGCAIRNQYSNNGSLIATTHEFYIAGEQRKSGVYLAIVRYCYPDPYTRVCASGWWEMFRANFSISQPRGAYQAYLPLLTDTSSAFTSAVRR